MIKIVLFIIIAGIGIIFPGCAQYPDIIRDESVYPQNTRLTISNIPVPDSNLMSLEDQKKYNLKFLSNYFSVWHRATNLYTFVMMTNIIDIFRQNPGFGENKRKHPEQWISGLETLADPTAFPNTLKRAITVRNTSMRLLPSMNPHFNDFNLPGEGFPFDNLQCTAVWANTPVFISHTSMDGRWVLAEMVLQMGWVPVDDIAFIDETFINEWESGDYLAITKDNTVIRDRQSGYRINSFIGSVFPFSVDHISNYECRIAIPDTNRNAAIMKGIVPLSNAVRMPLTLSVLNVSGIAQEMMGQNYGWGGMYENRDCSGTMKDLFTPFGIWLPKYTEDIATFYQFIPLTNLSLAEKEKQILKRGIPFFTLVWAKGHIMLYIGEFSGKPLIFQNVWGVRTESLFKGEGRFIIGKTIISTLEPGLELPDLSQRGNLLNRVKGIIMLNSNINQ